MDKIGCFLIQMEVVYRRSFLDDTIFILKPKQITQEL